jgi:hypothetical protein
MWSAVHHFTAQYSTVQYSTVVHTTSLVRQRNNGAHNAVDSGNADVDDWHDATHNT